ncbi:MAG: hypothetical protein RQ824_03275 [bacterium]|nr:hypothetical protein [bacterium]
MIDIINHIKRKASWIYRGGRFGYDSLIDLNESQWWSKERLELFQNERLRHIIKYAYINIPEYKKKFDKVGIKPEEIQTIKDLKKLPITTREEMQGNEGYINKNLITETLYTGGSTGASLKYYESYEAGQIRWNAHLRGWRWNGYEYSKDKLAIISSAQGIVKGDNTINLVGDLTEKNLEKNVKQLLDYKPRFIRGYVGSVYILAKYCLDRQIELPSIDAVNVISENLYDFQRDVIENAFKCRVFEEYCCNDGGACAWECGEHEGLHYVMERAIIEEIDEEMIVTDLWNKAMPFIRYINGDSVNFSGEICRCGRELPLINVKGRDNDILITNKGVISPTFLMYHGIGYGNEVKFRSGISSIQYVQKPGLMLEVNIVKNSWCRDEEIKDFIQMLVTITSGLKMEINFMQEIPKSKKGKRQFIINEDRDLLKKWGYA